MNFGMSLAFHEIADFKIWLALSELLFVQFTGTFPRCMGLITCASNNGNNLLTKYVLKRFSLVVLSFSSINIRSLATRTSKTSTSVASVKPFLPNILLIISCRSFNGIPTSSSHYRKILINCRCHVKIAQIISFVHSNNWTLFFATKSFDVSNLLICV